MASVDCSRHLLLPFLQRIELPYNAQYEQSVPWYLYCPPGMYFLPQATKMIATIRNDALTLSPPLHPDISGPVIAPS